MSAVNAVVVDQSICRAISRAPQEDACIEICMGSCCTSGMEIGDWMEAIPFKTSPHTSLAPPSHFENRFSEAKTSKNFAEPAQKTFVMPERWLYIQGTTKNNSQHINGVIYALEKLTSGTSHTQQVLSTNNGPLKTTEWHTDNDDNLRNVFQREFLAFQFELFFLGFSWTFISRSSRFFAFSKRKWMMFTFDQVFSSLFKSLSAFFCFSFCWKNFWFIFERIRFSWALSNETNRLCGRTSLRLPWSDNWSTREIPNGKFLSQPNFLIQNFPRSFAKTKNRKKN